MTKSKLYSKNLVKCGPLLNIFIILCCISGCSSSTTPTYLKEDIPEAIQSISDKEYKIDVKVRSVGQTIWIYMPVEDLFEKTDKPEKYFERFIIKQNLCQLKNDSLKIDYQINPVPEEEKKQELTYNKQTLEKINNVWSVIRRVLFSMERLKTNEPQFIGFIAADIKNGFELKEISYYLDLKKVSYQFISNGEYQHRTLQDLNYVPQTIGNKDGSYFNYVDITLVDFITKQIQNRVRLKFQKPEVEKNADIDKEIMKIVVYTIKTYGFKDFSDTELNNLATNNKVILSRAAIWAKSTK